MRRLKRFIYELLLAAAALLGVWLLAGLSQGAVGLLSAVPLLLLDLLALNLLCGLLLPAPAPERRCGHGRAPARRVRVAAVQERRHRPALQGGHAA